MHITTITQANQVMEARKYLRLEETLASQANRFVMPAIDADLIT